MATNFVNKRISSIQLYEENYHIKSIPFHATEAEWQSINYVPKDGELIIYDIDQSYNYKRYKTGDGTTQAHSLPFSLVSITEMETYINSEINSAGHLKRVVLGTEQALPSLDDADADTIYMKPFTGGSEQDFYEEFMKIDGKWEIIGSTKVDLSNYVTNDELNQKGFITGVEAGLGLEITKNDDGNPTIDIDDTVIFIIDCGTSTEVI